MIVFEDLHWADSESIALFERIADLEGDRLLLGTYRPAEVIRRNPIAGLLDRLERRHAVYHVRLERLGLAETSALLAAATGQPPPYRAAVVAAQPHRRQPVLPRGAAARPATATWRSCATQPLPWSLAEALRRQVEHLEPAQQRLVEAAAVLGHRVPVRPARRGDRHGRGRADRALRDLVGAGRAGRDRRGRVQRSGTRWSARRSASGCSAASAGGCTRPRSTRCWPPATPTGRWSPSTPGAPAATTTWSPPPARGSAAYLAHGLGVPGAAARRDGPGGGARRPGAARRRRPRRLAGRAARRRRRRTPGAGSAAADDPGRTRSRRCACASGWPGRPATSTPCAALSDRAASGSATSCRPGPEQARAMAALAQSARLRDLDDEALDWADRAVALADELGELDAVRLAALAEKGAAAGRPGPAPWTRGARCWPRWPTRPRRRGEWLVAACALNKLVHLPPVAAWRELRRPAGTDAHATPSGPARSGSRSPPTTRAGPGCPCARATWPAAIAAIERGRAPRPGLPAHPHPLRPHGVFLAGLRLEAVTWPGPPSWGRRIGRHRGSLAARSESASIETSRPGAMTPPRYSPSADTASTLIEVPKSTARQRPPIRS